MKIEWSHKVTQRGSVFLEFLLTVATLCVLTAMVFQVHTEVQAEQNKQNEKPSIGLSTNGMGSATSSVRRIATVPQLDDSGITTKDIAVTVQKETVPSKKIETPVSPKSKVVATSAPKVAVMPTKDALDGVGLTQNGITVLTNAERSTNGNVTLKRNPLLDKIALIKAQDMVKHEYFAHLSPVSGLEVGGLADKYGYEYTTVGENLAMGTFHTDAELVEGWMNSPGHRANILNSHYTEIGIAAVVGSYQGQAVWYAVQEFGRPLPQGCTSPSVALRDRLSRDQKDLATLQKNISAMKLQVEASQENSDAYASLVNQYNALVTQFSEFVVSAQGRITTYNNSVVQYNSCIGVEE